MAFFIILAIDRADALAQRIALRDNHLAYWAGTGDAVKVAGAMLDGDIPAGSVFLIEATDEAEARTLLANDPFARDGIFSEDVRLVRVRPAIGEWLPLA